MSHPSHYYIKYMILQGWPKETVDSVNKTLLCFGFPEIPDAEFDLMVSGLEVPEDFDFNNKVHQPTIEFLKAEKIYDLWVGKKEDLSAVDIVAYPQIRETAQILLLGRFSSEEVCERIKVKFNREISEKTIDTFKHYFWNCELVGIQELRELIKQNYLRDAYIAAMWGGRNQALYRAGFNPQIDGRKALKEMHRGLTMRIEASRLLPDSKDTAQVLALLGKELIKVHSALYGDGAGVEDMMKELQKFIMHRNAPNVVPIQKVAPKGNFSGSGKKTDLG